MENRDLTQLLLSTYFICHVSTFLLSKGWNNKWMGINKQIMALVFYSLNRSRPVGVVYFKLLCSGQSFQASWMDGWIRLIVGFQALMVISPTASCWCVCPVQWVWPNSHSFIVVYSFQASGCGLMAVPGIPHWAAGGLQTPLKHTLNKPAASPTTSTALALVHILWMAWTKPWVEFFFM